MKKQFIAMQIAMLSFIFNANAGGVSSTETCTHADKVLISAPMQVYLPDGNTKATVGEASLVSRKTKCQSSEYESINIQLKLDDEIKPYGIKIKDTITGFESQASLEFRLKEIVNLSESFQVSSYAKTKINHFGSVGTLAVEMNRSDILFWMHTTSVVDGVIHAQMNGQSANPLACSIERGYVTLTKKANDKDGLEKDLTLTAFFNGSLQLCP